MKKIKRVWAREVFDSRGNPTIEVEVELNNSTIGRAIVPSGASKGEHEALELRDEDKNRFQGKGVQNAIKNINEIIAPKILSMPIDEQRKIDRFLIELDGSSNKKNLGANALLGVSLACAKAAASYYQMPLYRYLGGIFAHTLPVPLMNVINGGVHADSSIDFQEYFIIPAGFSTFHEALQAGVEIFHCLKSILKEKGYSTSVGDEGGFAPLCQHGNEEPLELILLAIKKANYIPGKQIFLGLDVASSEFYNSHTKKYHLKKSKQGEKSSDEMIEWYQQMMKKYPIVTIEDGLAESDWDGWKKMTDLLKNNIQLVGDDLFVTNIDFLKKGVSMNVGNAILIKLNQIGTLTETLDTILFAQRNGYRCIISHRSGESEDTTIADLAVATNAGQIKTGSASRSDRMAKYNQLLRIEEELKTNAVFEGLQIFNQKKN